MHRFLAAATLAATLIVSACGAGTAASPSPSITADPTPAPSESAPPSPTAAPSEAPPSETPSDEPSEVPASPTADEQYLIDGALRDAEDCQPIRVDLPTGAIAGIECTSDDPSVARIGFYLFEDDETMLDAYFARMDEEGVARESGGCVEGGGEGEGAYTPGEGEVASRAGCFINDQGYANYRVTLPGAHVYIGILGRSADMAGLSDFAWRGNQDVPGNPTLWAEPAS